MASPDFDVAIAGGGPAGATAALTLAGLGLRVALVESSRYEAARVGETLPPAVRPVLARLGVAESVAALGSTPSFGNRSAWGGEDAWSNPFVFGPHGNGWHVDRARFDRLLADAARAAGAAVLEGTRVRACARATDGPWHVDLGGDGLTANALLDASGRRGALARSLGARRRLLDRLVGVAVRYAGPAHDAGHTLVEAEPDGWWYSAPIPPDRTMVMFMTDSDLCRQRGLTDPETWRQRLSGTLETSVRIAGHQALERPAVVSAASHRLERTGFADRWLAAGDAAISLDPLSSSGVLRALLAGEAAGYALAHWLIGRLEAARDYERWLDAQFDEYVRERRAYYSLESRWPDAPFWRRRRDGQHLPATAGVLRSAAPMSAVR